MCLPHVPGRQAANKCPWDMSLQHPPGLILLPPEGGVCPTYPTVPGHNSPPLIPLPFEREGLPLQSASLSVVLHFTRRGIGVGRLCPQASPGAWAITGCASRSSPVHPRMSASSIRLVPRGMGNQGTGIQGLPPGRGAGGGVRGVGFSSWSFLSPPGCPSLSALSKRGSRGGPPLAVPLSLPSRREGAGGDPLKKIKTKWDSP